MILHIEWQSRAKPEYDEINIAVIMAAKLPRVIEHLAISEDGQSYLCKAYVVFKDDI